VNVGMKQLFGTQAVSMGGFLVLYPIEDQAKLDVRRAEFNLTPMSNYIKNLERIYGKPLVKARQAPTSQLSKQLTDSVTKAIDSTQLEGEEVDRVKTLLNARHLFLNFPQFVNGRPDT
jgi:hypothetical protein